MRCFVALLRAEMRIGGGFECGVVQGEIVIHQCKIGSSLLRQLRTAVLHQGLRKFGAAGTAGLRHIAVVPDLPVGEHHVEQGFVTVDRVIGALVGQGGRHCPHAIPSDSAQALELTLAGKCFQCASARPAMAASGEPPPMILLTHAPCWPIPPPCGCGSGFPPTTA